jgi:methionine-rich copper-binding protein CopC
MGASSKQNTNSPRAGLRRSKARPATRRKLKSEPKFFREKPLAAIHERDIRFRMRSVTIRAVLAFLLLTGALPSSAWSHARMVRSEPAKDAEVSGVPDHVSLWFNELLEDGFNTITVFPAKELTEKKRTNLVTEKPRVNPQDRTQLSVKLPSLPPGEYILEWRVLSRDGHSAPGRITFRVKAR